MIEISGFGTVLLFVIGSIVFVSVTLFASFLLRPLRPNEEKNKTYESGEEPVSTAWGVFNIRFYIIALIFLLFETELVFLFPWAVVFGDKDLIAETNGLWGAFSLIETFIFIAILALGLVYVWVNGMLEWIKPNPESSEYQSKIPSEAYNHLKD